MALHMVRGNLLDTHCTYICHQVNCCGVMGSGVAKAIREKWPRVYEYYHSKFEAVNAKYFDGEKLFLGDIQIVPLYDDFYKDVKHQKVINIFAQGGYGYDGRRYTSYDAFWTCLGEIKNTIGLGETIAFPYKIGSDRGGANWNVIRTMIEEVLGEDYEVFIYRLED